MRIYRISGYRGFVACGQVYSSDFVFRFCGSHPRMAYYPCDSMGQLFFPF